MISLLANGIQFYKLLSISATCLIDYVYPLIAGGNHLVSGQPTDIARPTTSPPGRPTHSIHGQVKHTGTLCAHTVNKHGMVIKKEGLTGTGNAGPNIGTAGAEVDITTFDVIFTSKLTILDLA